MRVEQPAAGVGECVEDDLVLAPRVRQASGAQRAQVVTDEVLRARGDPRQVTHAELAAIVQGERDQQSGWVGERLCASGCPCCDVEIQVLADRLGAREVKTQQVTAVVAQSLRLTHVAVRARADHVRFIVP